MINLGAKLQWIIYLNSLRNITAFWSPGSMSKVKTKNSDSCNVLKSTQQNTKLNFLVDNILHYFLVLYFIWDATQDLLPTVQFKKHEKLLCRSFTFSKVRLCSATLLKVTLLHRFFSRFLNCTNGKKYHKASHINNRCMTFWSAAISEVLITLFPTPIWWKALISKLFCPHFTKKLNLTLAKMLYRDLGKRLDISSIILQYLTNTRLSLNLP